MDTAGEITVTFQEYFLKYLQDNSLSYEMATTILERCKSDLQLKDMSGRWKNDINEYPASIRIIVKQRINQIALAYIDEVLPEAWFRVIFL